MIDLVHAHDVRKVHLTSVTNDALVFCAPPEGDICLTCGTHLKLGDYGKKPAVIPKKKKKRAER